MDIIDKILKKDYSLIFSNDKNKISTEYKTYAKQVHPDINKDPRATEAFRILTELKEKALEDVARGIWEQKGFIQFSLTNGARIKIHYQYHKALEICEYYVCRERVIYVFDSSKRKFYDRYKLTISHLHYENSSMKDTYSKLVPSGDIKYYETTDEKLIISFHKESDVYPLRAVIENFWKGAVPGKHLAWITSRIMSLLAFLNYNNLVLNGIDIDSCFVSLKGHAIYFYGGWWFAAQIGSPMIGTTSKIYSIMPAKVKADKTSSYLTDIESIKLMMRELCAQSPQQMKDYYSSGSCSSHFEEWKKWDEALDRAYGERKFIVINATDNEIYIKE